MIGFYLDNNVMKIVQPLYQDEIYIGRFNNLPLGSRVIFDGEKIPITASELRLIADKLDELNGVVND